MALGGPDGYDPALRSSGDAAIQLHTRWRRRETRCSDQRQSRPLSLGQSRRDGQDKKLQEAAQQDDADAAVAMDGRA